MQLLDQFVSVMQTPDVGEASNPVHGFRSERSLSGQHFITSSLDFDDHGKYLYVKLLISLILFKVHWLTYVNIFQQ